MEQEFVTIAEAALFMNKTDSEIMRLLKDRLQSSGLPLESIMKKEQREKGTMLLVNKGFLLHEMAQIPAKEEPAARTSFAPITEQGELLQTKDSIISMLQKIVETKDKQLEDLAGKIDELIERDRETNILLKGLQDRMFLLEDNTQKSSPQEKKKSETK